MSRSQAVSEAQRLKRIVESYGIRCTIELQQGRPHSNRWYTRKHVLMSHHTAGPSSGSTPSLSVCKYGRAGLPGPLCNGYMGRDKVFRIICMGLANHPGAGGPLTRDGVTLPRNSARIGSFGIEYEHDGVSSWPSGMRDAMARANAAVLDWMDRPTTSAVEHSTWTPRKIDRAPGYSRSGSTGQSEIAAVRGTNVEDDMARIDDDQAEAIAQRAGEWAAHEVWMQELESPETGKEFPAYQYLLSAYERVNWSRFAATAKAVWTEKFKSPETGRSWEARQYLLSAYERVNWSRFSVTARSAAAAVLSFVERNGSPMSSQEMGDLEAVVATIADDDVPDEEDMTDVSDIEPDADVPRTEA